MTVEELKKWAQREVELVLDGSESDELFTKGYNAFCIFLNGITNAQKIAPIAAIFNQLLNGIVLSPIEDNDEDWMLATGLDPSFDIKAHGWSIYECKRRPSLMKKVFYNKKGEIEKTEYTDTERAICIDIGTSQTYTGGPGFIVLDEVLPITMPYYPMGKIKIFTEEFCYHKNFEEDSDTIAVLYFRMDDGQMKEIKRFFKKGPETKEIIEINWSEYAARKAKFELSKKEKE